jgi:hypothetical protein
MMTRAISSRVGLFARISCVFLVCAPCVSAAELTGEALAAWNDRVRSVEARRARELARGGGFLALDFHFDSNRIRQALLQGAVVAREGRMDDERSRVPGGTIQHWRGAVFVRGVTLDRLLAALRDPRRHGYRPQDVLEWRLLERSGDRERVFLKIRRQEIVEAVFATEHDVTFTRHGPDRASSRSTASRIAEIENGREQPPGRDRGFLWRLNSYWRYEAVPGGVLVELESLTLSRDVPALLAPIATPVVRRIARESIERTLTEIRDQLGSTPAAFAPGAAGRVPPGVVGRVPPGAAGRVPPGVVGRVPPSASGRTRHQFTEARRQLEPEPSWRDPVRPPRDATAASSSDGSTGLARWI